MQFLYIHICLSLFLIANNDEPDFSPVIFHNELI